VTRALSEHQRYALDRYGQLLAEHPDLFTGRNRRPIVRDRSTLDAYAADHDVVLGVTAETPYLWMINDLVQSRQDSGTPIAHPYLRIIAPPQTPDVPGVVILATIQNRAAEPDELIILVEQERHATGRLELELPRGFGDPATAPGDHALVELRQETGYVGQHAEHLGTTLTDSGTTNRSVSFFHVPVTGRENAAPESHEAVVRVVSIPRSHLWLRIESGAVRDAFTVQALAFYERHLLSQGNSTP
jgi:ADP-ribose pyrophosphatase